MIERAEACPGGFQVFLSSAWIRSAKPASALPNVKEFPCQPPRRNRPWPTCRRKHFGGLFTGSLKAELEVLLAAAEAGARSSIWRSSRPRRPLPGSWTSCETACGHPAQRCSSAFTQLSRTKIWIRRRCASRFSSRISSRWFRRPSRWPTTWPSSKLINDHSRSAQVIGHRHGRGRAGEPRAGPPRRRGFTFAAFSDGPISDKPATISTQANRPRPVDRPAGPCATS